VRVVTNVMGERERGDRSERGGARREKLSLEVAAVACRHFVQCSCSPSPTSRLPPLPPPASPPFVG
jgi:hypothetical protein